MTSTTLTPSGSRIHIDINQVRSQAASVASDEEDELHDPGVHSALPAVSPQYSIAHTQSQSGSSSHPDGPPHAIFPDELPSGEVDPADSASRQDPRERPRQSRSNSARRDPPRSRPRAEPPARARRPVPAEEQYTDSEEDSTEAFIGEPDYVMPRQTSYYGPNGYAHSGSSAGGYAYPPVHPPSTQVAIYGHAQPHMPHPQQYPPSSHAGYPGYPPVASPPIGYAGSQPSHHPASAMSYNPPSHYQSPYGPPSIVQHHGPPAGYFPPGYAAPHPYAGYPQPAPYAYPQSVPPLPAYIDQWRVGGSPHPDAHRSPSSSASDKPAVDQEEIIKRMRAMILEQDKGRAEREAQRQRDIQSADDKLAAIRQADRDRQLEESRIKAEATKAAIAQAEEAQLAMLERAKEEARIRKEATEAAQQAIEDARIAAAKQAEREANIRQEAAKAALDKAAEDAKAKAEQEAKEKKIAAEAAEAAKSEAEKKAADEAKKAEEAAKKATEEAEKKLKEAEEAAAKAKKEAEEAQAAAKAAAPPERKPPVHFKDAIGRNYNFPWERCHKWRDMEGLIVQAFQHIEDLGEHVIHRRYDLIGPDKEIIMPEYWDVTVQPDMHVTMMLWPMPEKPGPLDGDPLGGDNIIDLDEILNPTKKKKKKQGGGFASWMLGGAPSRPKKSVKGDRRA